MKLNDVEIEQAELERQLSAQGYEVTLTRKPYVTVRRPVGLLSPNTSGLSADSESTNPCFPVALQITTDFNRRGYRNYDQARLQLLVDDLRAVGKEMRWNIT